MLASTTISTVVKRFTILPAISLDGVLHVVVIEGSANADLFLEFLETLLDAMNPFPGRNSVLVLDNVGFHHDGRVVERVLER